MPLDFPNNPNLGDITSLGTRTWRWNGTVWAEVFDIITSVPSPSALDTHTGRIAFSDSNKKLYGYGGSWGAFQMANASPTWSTEPMSTLLNSDGTATNITAVAADPEGLTGLITYSHTTTATNQVVSIVQNSTGVFTVTPTTTEANMTDFTITITATDTLHTLTKTITCTYTPPGGFLFTTLGSHTWVVPPKVSSVHVVAIGAGGHSDLDAYQGAPGGGGGLAWKNNISVTAGDTIAVFVGSGARTNTGISEGSYFQNATTVKGFGGGEGGFGSTGSGNAGYGGGYVGDGGGRGGNSAGSAPYNQPAGGGAGGYSGAGGDGAAIRQNLHPNSLAPAGQGGGGGGAAEMAGGGGVGVYGEGTSGLGASMPDGRYYGLGGSGGGNGTLYQATTPVSNAGGSGFYGGGQGNADYAGGQGAVRIIYGVDRAFPSTNTDLSSSTETWNASTSAYVSGEITI